MIGQGLLLRYPYEYDYLVCFQPRERCKDWLGKIFGHVMLMRNVTGECAIKIEPTWGGTMIIPYTCNVKTIWDALNLEYRTYVYSVKHDDMKRLNMVLFGSCVGTVKNLLGIRAWWIITPWQLERYIKRLKKDGLR